MQIEAARDEVESIREGALSVVRIKLYHGDGSEPEAVTMEIETFNELAGDTDMADVIHRAEPAYPPRRQVRSAPMSTGEKPDYATLEQAGKPHRAGPRMPRKRLSATNFDKINERLERDGMRTISLADPEMVARYGLARNTR